MTLQSKSERNQNFWQLMSIQCAAQSVLGVLVGGVLSQKYGPMTAILSIGVGNLILWLVGLAVITSSNTQRRNAVENVKEYLGKSSSQLISLILTIAFISWYMLELQTACDSLMPIFHSNTTEKFCLSGGILGVFISFLSLGGIKWICVASFPLLLCFVLYGILAADHSALLKSSLSLSLPAIIGVVGMNLPGTVNLPTFFRHSRSRPNSKCLASLQE